MQKIGIIGYGNYGHLLHALIRRFALYVDVVIYDPECVIDGRTFVPLTDMADCDAVIFAVPMHEYEGANKRLLRIKDLREDMVFVNVCSDQVRSGEIMAALAGRHPYICAHGPWGPQAYSSVEEVVSRLPAIVLTQHTLSPQQFGELKFFLESKGLSFTQGMGAVEHDTVLAGRQMYLVHLVTQVMKRLGMLDGDCSASTMSFQLLVRAANMVRFDEQLFYDLWIKVPECEKTLGRFLAAIEQLRRSKDDHANGK